MSEFIPSKPAIFRAGQLRETLRSPGRRLILGGIPVAVTLASKPALAAAECSVSNALSGNLSHPLPEGTNCGMTPQCWTNLAGSDQLWSRTGCTPSTRFTTACGITQTNLVWNCGSQSLLAALEGGLIVSCKISGQDTNLTAGSLGAHFAAGILNAACFAPTNYPKSTAQVKSVLVPIWAVQPANQSVAQVQLDGATAQVQPFNINS